MVEKLPHKCLSEYETLFEQVVGLHLCLLNYIRHKHFLLKAIDTLTRTLNSEGEKQHTFRFYQENLDTNIA